MKFSETKTWYEESAENLKPRFDSLQNDTSCDVCIVGGGLAAVAAALTCIEAGKRVVVLEASNIAYGSTGRDGVPVYGGFRSEFNDIVRLVGDEKATEVWGMTLEARQKMTDRIRTHNLDCSYSPGVIFAGKNVKHKRSLERRAFVAKSKFAEQEPVELLNGTEFHDRVRCEGFSKALLCKNGGYIQPLKLLYGLIQVAVDKGVKFYENTPVSHFSYGEPHMIQTKRGVVETETLLVCGNAYMPEFSAPHQTTSVATRYFQWVSKPIGANLARDLSSGREAVFDMSYLPSYFSVTLDNRIVLGGPDYFFEKNPRLVCQRIYSQVRQLFPLAKNLKSDYLWRGKIGINMNPMPTFEKGHENMYIAHGMSGHGLVVSYMSGLKLAEAALGNKKDFDALASVKMAKLPKLAYHVLSWVKITKYKLKHLFKMYVNK